jgi:hypothetical protein
VSRSAKAADVDDRAGRTSGSPSPYPRRRTAGIVPVAVGAAVAAVVLCAAVGVYEWTASGRVGGGADPAAPAAETSDPDSAGGVDGRPFRLVAISADGNRPVVTFLDGTGEIASTEVPSGWAETVANQAGSRANLFSVSTVSDGGTGDGEDMVTCRVTQAGRVVVERTTTGASPTADCGRF